MQIGLLPAIRGPSKVRDDIEKTALYTPLWMCQVEEIEVLPVIKSNGCGASRQQIQRIRSDALDNSVERHDVIAKLGQELQILSQSNMIVIDVVIPCDVYRMIGKHQDARAHGHLMLKRPQPGNPTDKPIAILCRFIMPLHEEIGVDRDDKAERRDVAAAAYVAGIAEDRPSWF